MNSLASTSAATVVNAPEGNSGILNLESDGIEFVDSVFMKPKTCWDTLAMDKDITDHVFGLYYMYIPNSAFTDYLKAVKHFDKSNYLKRLETFYVQNWPKQMAQDPSSLAKAGFFYSGMGDKCYTFCCGVGVHQWNHFDDPWKEHMKWAPFCNLPKLVGKQK